MIAEPEPAQVSKRIQQLNSLVQHEVAELLLRHIEWPFDQFDPAHHRPAQGQARGTLVTVNRVSVSPDAENAKVWLSVLPANQGEVVMKAVHAQIREIQTALNKKLVMKFVPKLTFALDLAEEKADKINRALDQLEHEEK